MNRSHQRPRKQSFLVGDDEVRFVWGKPWTKCHAERDGQIVPITEKLMISTIWWWRNRFHGHDELHKQIRLRSGLITTGPQHEWRVKWESLLFFYELHARIGDGGFIFNAPGSCLRRGDAVLLKFAERGLNDDDSFNEKDLVIADLKTIEGREIAYNAIVKRKSGHRNTAPARKPRPWRLIEVLDKEMLLSPPYKRTDAERSGISRIRREYLTRHFIYSSLIPREGVRRTSCKKGQFSSSKAQQQTK